jgi:hypothetical protein
VSGCLLWHAPIRAQGMNLGIARIAGPRGPANHRKEKWMNAIAMNANALESNLLARNEQASAIGTMFEMVRGSAQVVMCSDCCTSNGNKCDPNDTYELP